MNRTTGLLLLLLGCFAAGNVTAQPAPPGGGGTNSGGGGSGPSFSSPAYGPLDFWIELLPLGANANTADLDALPLLLHGTTNGSYYELLCATNLVPPIVWTTEQGFTGTGNATLTQLMRKGRSNLFVRARTSGLDIISQPLSQNVCVKDTLTFSITAGGNSALTYQWTWNGTNIAGATNSSFTLFTVQDGDAGDYAVIVSSGTNSVTSSNATLTTFAPEFLPNRPETYNVVSLSGPRQDCIFKSGLTYYISYPVQLFGHTTIEKGAVLKFDESYNSTLQVMGSLDCQGEPYLPAILTSVDDDAVGEPITWVTNDNPQTATNGMAYLDLSAMTCGSVKNLRVCFADAGILSPFGRLDTWDCQFLACNAAILASQGATESLHNALFAGCGTAVQSFTNFAGIEAEQVTAYVSNFWNGPTPPARISLTNSIIFGTLGSGSLLSTQHVILNPPGAVFQTADYGHYYLATNAYRYAGTTNISPQLLAEFKNKTTYPPFHVAPNLVISGQMTFFPQVPRYTNGAPDLGYWYDAIDYTVANMTLTSSAAITVQPGTAIAVRNEDVGTNGWSFFGFDVTQGAAFVSYGTPNHPNIFTAEKMVQEEPVTDFAQAEFSAGFWFGTVLFIPDYQPVDATTPAPTLDFRFSKFYLPRDDYHIFAGTSEKKIDMFMSLDSAVYLSLRDCSLYGGVVNLGEPDYFSTNGYYTSGAVAWTNNLFESVAINLDPTFYEYAPTNHGLDVDLSFQAGNNLFWHNPFLHVEPIPATAGNWTLRNNLFDRVRFQQDALRAGLPLDCDYNSYWPLTDMELVTGDYATNRLLATVAGSGAHEQTLAAVPPYQTGTFGNYYLPANTPLYHAGCTTADQLGLYHYTTQTNQVKQGFSTVDIGLHYLAATNGLPLDSDGDGIPDYVENWHGDGLYANHTDTETDWQNPYTLTGVFDPTNAVYDNIDLSGNGLVGRLKKTLGTDAFGTNTPLTLTQVTTGEETDIASFEVPINYDFMTNIGNIYISIDGAIVSWQGVSKAANSNCILEWNTTYSSPGQHALQVRIDLNGESLMGSVPDPTVLTAMGPLLPFYSSNVLQFDPSISDFDDTGALFSATLATAVADYSIEIQDWTSNHIRYINGSTTTASVDETWDLKDDNQNIVTNEQVQVVYNITPAGQATSQSKQKRRKSLGLSDGNFTIAYAWDNANMAQNAMWTSLEGGVVNPLTGPPESGGSSSLTPYTSFFNRYTWSGDSRGYPGLLSSTSDVTNLLNNLTNAVTRNFFMLGHGSTTHIGDKGQIQLSKNVIGEMLGNGYFLDTKALQRNHPFRFAFLFGCNTADSTEWSEAFGIPEKISTNQVNSGKVQAFLGWQGKPPAPSDNQGWYDTGSMFTIFFTSWMNGQNLKRCIADASNSSLNWPISKKYLAPASPQLNTFQLGIYGYPLIKRNGND